MTAQEDKISLPSQSNLTVDTFPHHPSQCAGIHEILSRIGDKWSVLVVMELREGPFRFNALKRRIARVSQHMLALTLRGLERDGLVTRTVYPTVPPRVDYELTPLGHSLREPIETLGIWAMANQSTIKQAQAAFDALATKS